MSEQKLKHRAARVEQLGTAVTVATTEIEYALWQGANNSGKRRQAKYCQYWVCVCHRMVRSRRELRSIELVVVVMARAKFN